MSDEGIGCFAAIALLATIAIVDLSLSTYNDGWRTCTVKEKDRASGDYRIYTRDCGVLTDTDDWLHGKHDSADVYSRIEPGRTYQFRLVGPRFRPFSWFPNILAVDRATSY